MIKKALAIAGAGAVLLSMAGPAFGMGWWWMGGDDVTIRNVGTVNNTITNSANTGHNDIGGMCVHGGRILTGGASATANVGNDVNSNGIGCFSCDGDIDIYNTGLVNNRVTNRANTGYNHIGGMFVGGGLISTGNAGASTLVTNFVNTNMVGF